MDTKATKESGSKATKETEAQSLGGEPAEEKVGEAFTPEQQAQIEAGEYPTANTEGHTAAEKAKLQADQEARIEGAAEK